MQQPKGPLPPPRGVPKSVSDLYGTDEIDFLLDEIKDLEPACCQLEDIQVDFAEAPLKPPRTTRPPPKNQQLQHHHHQQQYQPLKLSHPSTSTPRENFFYTPSPQRKEAPYHSRYDEDQADDNFILIIPSPKLSAKHNKNNRRDAAGKKGGFLKRVFRRKTVEGVEQQRMVQFQTDKELHEIEVLDAKGRHKKKNKNLVVLAGRVDTTEEDDDIVPISIGENDNEDVMEELPCDPQAGQSSGGGDGGGDKGKKEVSLQWTESDNYQPEMTSEFRFPGIVSRAFRVSVSETVLDYVASPSPVEPPTDNTHVVIFVV